MFCEVNIGNKYSAKDENRILVLRNCDIFRRLLSIVQKKIGILQLKSNPMIKITLPDGSIKAHEKGITPMDVAKSISEGLARNVISAKFNEEVIETKTPLTSDGDLVLFTWENKEGKKAFWHSSAHILAQAILFYYPNAKLTIGPAIDNGFYYDIDFEEESISENDFKKIEDKMSRFFASEIRIQHALCLKADALAYDHKSNNVYKVD